MRATNLYAPTLREMPSDAELISHKLMLRGGFMRKSANGMYNFLPLGWKVIKKIENIIRDEMDKAGGQEIMMPILQPSELWEESGRWAAYGEEMMRLKDRHGHSYSLGPTHEEMITALVRNEVRSYKQLPLMLYQIQDKFRDERRPRFGLMRSREFIMKDLYSFDKDEAGMNISYEKMYKAYGNIFTRVGLKYRPVEADNGAIGGGHSHEFTAISDAGESFIACCTKCDYAASDEKAELKAIIPENETEEELKKVPTPNAHTIDLLVKCLNIPIEKTIKAVAYQTEQDELVLVFVRGDHDVNEAKVLHFVENARELRMADEDAIKAAGGCPGFMSPIGIKKGTKTLVDLTAYEMKNAVSGANEVDTHYTGVNPKRDFKNVIVADIRMVKEGDACPRCGAPFTLTRGIEVGQVFTLGTKYSEAMKATFLDENGKDKPFVMGCYGIGVGRTMAAIIEQKHDENGIIWPLSVAPFEVVVVPVNAKNEDQLKAAEKIYDELREKNIDALLDDRAERAGVKFKDADLIGYPLRITVGPKTVDEGIVEVKIRKTGDIKLFNMDNYLSEVLKVLEDL
ncbi:MAG: proline--tRNA ligase [Selenomonadaceae bacterium]|nr:proline--tRNA ligase [Selenomonadaceae bacterium]